MAEDPGMGGRIRSMRLARNLTLKDVERKANVSATHVSEIERGLTSPTVGALSRIADALGVPACRLLDAVRGPRVTVVRRDERTILADVRSGARYHRLTGGFEGAGLSMVEIELEPDAARAVRPFEHGGEEFFHVLGGTVEVTIADGLREVLERGDSIHLRARPGRELHNVGGGAARVLWVTAPPFIL